MPNTQPPYVLHSSLYMTLLWTPSKRGHMPLEKQTSKQTGNHSMQVSYDEYKPTSGRRMIPDGCSLYVIWEGRNAALSE